MCTPLSRVVLGVSLALLILPNCDAAAAPQCATTPMTARGEPAAFEWLAKTKARANWRLRVRATKGLGAPYETWSNAHDTSEVCTPSTGGSICVFTGVPCTRS